MSTRTVASRLLLGASVGLLACGHARPYRAMARAARSEENLASRLEDRATKAELRATLMEDDALGGTSIAPYVYMGRVFLVGSVATAAQRDAAVADAWKVQGVRSVEDYLPQAPRGKRAASSAASDLALKAELKGKLSSMSGSAPA